MKKGELTYNFFKFLSQKENKEMPFQLSNMVGKWPDVKVDTSVRPHKFNKDNNVYVEYQYPKGGDEMAFFSLFRIPGHMYADFHYVLEYDLYKTNDHYYLRQSDERYDKIDVRASYIDVNKQPDYKRNFPEELYGIVKNAISNSMITDEELIDMDITYTMEDLRNGMYKSQYMDFPIRFETYLYILQNWNNIDFRKLKNYIYDMESSIVWYIFSDANSEFYNVHIDGFDVYFDKEDRTMKVFCDKAYPSARIESINIIDSGKDFLGIFQKEIIEYSPTIKPGLYGSSVTIPNKLIAEYMKRYPYED